MRKKIFVSLAIVLLLIVTGCGEKTNTPTNKVEEFLSKYQKMDSEVLAQLDNVVSSDTTMTDQQKNDYKTLMEKQYQNLSYKVKDEKITGNTATVDVEIEVYNYQDAISDAKKYYEEHKDEFKDNVSYIDYRIKQMQKVTEKIKYPITFNLTKENGVWKVEDLSDTDRNKLHGLYEG